MVHRLDLSGCSSAGQGLPAVAQLQQLACLDAADCQLSSASLEAIVQLPHLAALNLGAAHSTSCDLMRVALFLTYLT